MCHINARVMGEIPAVARTLRRQTRAAHHRLDHHPLLQRLVLPGLTWQAYAESLVSLYRPHAALEASVTAAAARLGLDAGDPAALRLPLLVADLHALAVHLPPAGRPDLDDLKVEQWPRAETPAALVGQCYVLEGSRLGGQVIARQVAERLGAHVPRDFFVAADPGWQWQRFLAFAERHCAMAEVGEAVAAAQVAFRHYLACLDAPAGA